MDQLLQMLQSADPSDDQPDLPELLHLEGNKKERIFSLLFSSLVIFCINANWTCSFMSMQEAWLQQHLLNV